MVILIHLIFYALDEDLRVVIEESDNLRDTVVRVINSYPGVHISIVQDNHMNIIDATEWKGPVSAKPDQKT